MPKIALQQPFAKFHGAARTTGAPGGQVLWSDGDANYSRSLVTPTNPKTAIQLAVRGIRNHISQQFQTLTPAERDAWETLGVDTERSNMVGAPYKLSAMAAFGMVNYYRLASGETITKVAPDRSGIASVSAVTSVTILATTLSVTIAHTVTDPPSSVQVRLTRPLASPVRRARKNEFRYAHATTLPQNFSGMGDSPMVFTITATQLGISIDDYIGVEVLPISAQYVPGVAFRLPSIQVTSS